ncbi:MAG: PDZ domain-containing protein [Acetatifactor sp.]|nr:PDZ domain-containing protein [Acetatifactor sp.]
MLVTEVEEGSPAENGGILRGDVITRFEGEKIQSYEDLKEIMQYYGPGTEVTVVVKRLLNGSYEDVELKLTLGRRP